MFFLAILRMLVVALVVLGMSASAMAYVMPNGMDQTVMAVHSEQNFGAPCGTMAAMDDAALKGGKSEIPCNKITLDCVNKMVCLQTAALPEHYALEIEPVSFVTVTYRVSAPLRKGRTLEPELTPPLAA
jgi:hypothetical protein